MFEQLGNIISIPHLNILFLLGLALFGGTVGGRLFQKFRIPQVVGYIAIGAIIGESGLKIVDQNVIQLLQPFNYFALSLIGFMVGCELRKDVFSRYGKQFTYILLCEGIAPFLLVTIFVGTVGSFFFGWKLAWALALLMGAIASATDPASTTEVFREYKTRGPVTTTTTGIVALDDGLAFILFSLASSIAASLTGRTSVGLLKSFLIPAYDIGGAIILGVVGGLILSKIIKKYSEEGRLLAFTVGALLLTTGLSLAIDVEMLLAAMTVGVIVVNFTPRKSKEVIKLIGGFTPPIYVLFFVLIGAKLNFKHMTLPTILLAVIYLAGTMSGKMAGSRFGAIISNAPQSVRKYLPLALFSQAGVAVGLSILAAQYFPGEISNLLIIIITTTTFLLQIIGPPFTKMAVTKAKEVGLNITEEDLMQKLKAKDIMDKNPPIIYNNTPLTEILEIFSETGNLYYPVTDKGKKLLGVITVDNLKNTFIETSLSHLLLAVDVMEPSTVTATPESTVFSVRELLGKYGLEYLPVVKEGNIIVGFIERRAFDKAISTRIIELQKQVDSLDRV